MSTKRRSQLKYSRQCPPNAGEAGLQFTKKNSFGPFSAEKIRIFERTFKILGRHWQFSIISQN